MRRFIALLLAMVMCFSFIGEFAFAEDTDKEIPSADAGENPAPMAEPGGEPDPVQNPTPIPVQESSPSPVPEPSPSTEPEPSPSTEPESSPSPEQEPSPEPSEEPGEEDDPNDGPHITENGLAVVVTSDKTEISGRMTAGTADSAYLTATVTRSDETVAFPESITWSSSLPSIEVTAEAGAVENGLTKTFNATAKYNGNLSFGSAVITAYASESVSGFTAINVVPAQFTAKIEDSTETGFEFALLNKTDNKYSAGDVLSFGFTDSEKNDDRVNYKDYVWEAVMRDITDTGDYPVYVGANAKNTEFTLYADSALTTTLNATGDVTITLTGKSPRDFKVTVTEDLALSKTVFAPEEVKKDTDYCFYVAHPEDRDPQEEDFESTEIYSLPLVTIDGDRYNGYKLEKYEESREFEGVTYSRYWMITIPAKRVIGDIVIEAKKCDIDESKYFVDLSAAAAGLVPFAEDETFSGKTVAIVDDENNKKQTYYFYYHKELGEAPHPVYSINGVSHALSPLPVIEPYLEREDSSLYKISGINGDVKVTLGYNVSKNGSGNNEELLIELPTETVRPGEGYTFRVRTHDMTEAQLLVNIAVGTHGLIYPVSGTSVAMTVKSDELGSYAEFTIPASSIDGDIVVEAQCASKVNNRVRFVDNYNIDTYKSIAYKSFEFTSPSLTVGTYSTNTHIGEFEAGKTGLCFEILNLPLYMVGSKPNVDGTSSDPNVYCYTYDFTGSTMGGKEVTVTPGSSYTDASGYHQMYDVNGGQPLTGDVMIKANLVPKSYSCTLIGTGTVTNRETYVNNNVTRYTTRRSEVPMYRYLFQVEANRAQTRKIYLRVYNLTSSEIKTYPYVIDQTTGGETAKAQIYGDYISGPITAKILANDEIDVYVTGNRANNVSFPYNDKDCDFYNGCVAKMGKDFTFTVSPAAKIKIKVGNTTLVADKQYASTADGNTRKYTVPGKYMTADTTIYATSTFNVTFSGKFEYAKPVGKAKPVQYDTVMAGEDYSFLLAEGSVSIYVGGKASTSGKVSGGRTLVKDKDYTEVNSIYTIKGASITDDLLITITPYESAGSTGYSSSKTTEKGIDIEIETCRYLVLDGEKTMYMVIVQGVPDENEYVCYNNKKMIWVESYGAYVWLEVSDEREEDFADHAIDLVDILYDEEIYFNLSSEAEDPDAPIVISEYEELYDITEDDELSCDVNEDGKVDEEDLILMRRIFDCDFKDFDDIKMRCFILADADHSCSLDMCDAAVIKTGFDSNKENKEE